MIKISLAISFVLFASNLVVAQQLEGAWGLKWGISSDSAILLIKESKGYVPEVTKTDTTTVLVYKHAKWGFEESTITRLDFYKNKFYSSFAVFIPDKGYKLITTYKNLKNSISEKYFPPQKDTSYFKGSYSKDDPDNVKADAILSGYGFIGCSWDFLIASNFKYYGSIDLAITQTSGLILWYQDEKISAIVDRQGKQKQAADF